MAEIDPAALLPQRPPFRFVDRVVETTEESAHCQFRMPEAGDCFSLRMLPEALLVEALAQTTAILMLAPREGDDGERPKGGVLGAVDGFRFEGRPEPGETIDLRARLRKQLGPVAMFQVEARRGQQFLCRGTLTIRSGDLR